MLPHGDRNVDGVAATLPAGVPGREQYYSPFRLPKSSIFTMSRT